MLEKCQCSLCGATDFHKEGNEFLRCAYCKSLYKILPQKNTKSGTTVTIKSGANVIFGKNAKVTINGKLIIENGATVSFLGEIEIFEKSSEEEIQKAKQNLELVKNK